MFNNPYNYYPYINMARTMNGINTMNGMNMASSAINPSPQLVKGGLFKSLSGIKWGEVLNNTQKTLNVINQAIPVYYQVKPIFSNVRNFSRLLTAFNSDDNISVTNNVSNNNSTNNLKKENSSNTPTFFID